MGSTSRNRSSDWVESLEARKLLSAEVIGYLPDYSSGGIPQIDWTALTRLNYFSFKPEQFLGASASFTPPTSTTGGGTIATMNSVVTTAHNQTRRVAVDLVIGGYGYSDQFPVIAADATKRGQFVTNLTTYAANHSFDGIDLDWEPSSFTDAQATAFGTLIAALKTAAPNLKLSVAVNPELSITANGAKEYVVPKTAIASLDNINAMCYDLGFANGLPSGAPYAQSTTDMQNWLDYGVPAAKLMFGVPFYGDSDYSYGVNATYQDLADAEVPFDPSLDQATLNGTKFYFNGQNTIHQKDQWILSHNTGGLVVWQVTQDHFTNGVADSKSLLPIIKADLISTVSSFATIDASGNVTATGTGGDDTFTASVSGSNLLLQLGSSSKSFPLSTVTTITINGTGGNDTLEYLGTISKPMTFNGGTGFDTLNVESGTYTFAADANAGNSALVVNVAAGASVAFNSKQHLDGLNLLGAATVAAGGGNLMVTNGLTIGSGGSLNLNNNDMIVDYTTTSPLATIGGYVHTARAANWAAVGLTSTNAKNNPNHNTSLGVISSAEYKSANNNATTFDSQAIDTTAILVKYTFNGDTDFNGKVNADDYSRLDAGFQNQHGNGFVYDWFHGDFDYNGSVNADDYGLIDAAYQTQGVLSILAAPAGPTAKSSRR